MSSFLENVIRRGAGLSPESSAQLPFSAVLPLTLSVPAPTEDDIPPSPTASEFQEPEDAETDADSEGLKHRDPARKFSTGARETRNGDVVVPSPDELKKRPRAVGESVEESEERDERGRTPLARRSVARPLPTEAATTPSRLLPSPQSPTQGQRRLSGGESEKDAGALTVTLPAEHSGARAFDGSDAASSGVSHEQLGSPKSSAPFEEFDARAQMGAENERRTPHDLAASSEWAERNTNEVLLHLQEPDSADRLALSDAGTAQERESSSSRVDVRIGSIEVRVTNPPEYERPGQPHRTRDFGKYSLARRYLNRRWY